jgi:hypothetical protein
VAGPSGSPELARRKILEKSVRFENSDAGGAGVARYSPQRRAIPLAGRCYLQFPQSQWKALRTTNALERINEEFRRRTKTQASLPDEDAVLLLLYGLLRSGQAVLRRIDGRNDLPKPKSQLKAA